MAQYKVGSVTLALNDATVTGIGTEFTTYVTAGDWFSRAASGVVYQVASVTDDTHLELSAVYGAASESSVPYSITGDFVGELALMSQGDIDTPTIFNRDMVLLNARIGGLTTVTGSTYTVLTTDRNLLLSNSGSPTLSVTLTLPAAASFSGRELHVKHMQAATVISASANVIPRTGGAAGTAILPATIGAWATLVSNGTAWVIMQASS